MDITIYVYSCKLNRFKEPKYNGVCVYYNIGKSFIDDKLVDKGIDYAITDISQKDRFETSIKLLNMVIKEIIDKIDGLTVICYDWSGDPYNNESSKLKKLVKKYTKKNITIPFNMEYDLTPNIIKEISLSELYIAIAYNRVYKGIPTSFPYKIINDHTIKKTTRNSLLFIDPLLFNMGDILTIDNRSVLFTGKNTLKKVKPKAGLTEVETYSDKSYVHYTGSNSKLRFSGKVDGDSRYNVLLLNKPDDLVNRVINEQNRIVRRLYKTDNLVVYNLKTIIGQRCNGLLSNDKDFEHLMHTSNGDLYTLNPGKDEISYVYNPPRLAFKINKIFENNLNILLCVINGTYNKNIYNVTDITKLLYNEGKVLSSIDKYTQYIRIDNLVLGDGKINIRADLSVDLPSFIHIKRLAGITLSVKIVYWLVDRCTVAYSFIYHTEEGWMYYSNYYGSRKILRRQVF
jgi:hypothetical protein